ncbi:MAG: hypothetical protein RLZZ500_155 [Bacteroidota bacterium]
MNNLTFVFIVFISMVGYSQTISKQVIGAAGKTDSASNLKMSWTTGEPVVGLMVAGDNQLGNGFYPAMDIQALSVEDITMSLQIKLYPNPTNQFLYVSHPDIEVFGIQIVDLNGKQIHIGTISKDHPQDFSNYSQGIYLVTIENKVNNQKNTYKIIKK